MDCMKTGWPEHMVVFLVLKVKRKSYRLEIRKLVGNKIYALQSGLGMVGTKGEAKSKR